MSSENQSLRQMIEQMRRISETVVSARWHRVAIWLIVLCIIGWMTSINAKLVDKTRDSVVLGAMATALPPTLLCDREGVVIFSNASALIFLEEEFFPKVWGHPITEWMTPELAKSHKTYFAEANKLPLGTKVPLETEFIVKGSSKSVTVNIDIESVNKERVFKVTWEDRESE